MVIPALDELVAKYGVTHDQVIEAYRKVKEKGATRFGLHTMVASNELDYTYMVETARATVLVTRSDLLALVPETGVEKARVFAERVRGIVEELALQWNGEPLLTSVSIGLAEVTDLCAPVDEFLRTADTNLYAAKQAGRNRVVG